jgi:phosphatidylglycerophosphate synthase
VQNAANNSQPSISQTVKVDVRSDMPDDGPDLLKIVWGLAVYDPHSPIRLWTAIGLVVVIMGSDFFDGKIARKKFGYVLDGLGDRAFHISAYLLLFITGALHVVVVWVRIFREISQYAIRLVDLQRHSNQSRADRVVPQIYTTIVQLLLLLELVRTALFPDSALSNRYPNIESWRISPLTDTVLSRSPSNVRPERYTPRSPRSPATALKDVEAIPDAHYLGRDIQLAETAVLKLESRTKL